MKRKVVGLFVVVVIAMLVYLLCRLIWPGRPEPTSPDCVNQKQVAAITTGLSEAEVLDIMDNPRSLFWISNQLQLVYRCSFIDSYFQVMIKDGRVVSTRMVKQIEPVLLEIPEDAEPLRTHWRMTFDGFTPHVSEQFRLEVIKNQEEFRQFLRTQGTCYRKNREGLIPKWNNIDFSRQMGIVVYSSVPAGSYVDIDEIYQHDQKVTVRLISCQRGAGLPMPEIIRAEIVGVVVNKVPEEVVLEIPAYLRREQE